MAEPLLDRFASSDLQALRRSLLRWYGKHARPLPWRETRDPYRIWISEIMLQQTTVKAVIPYFERFMARFPAVVDLARASEAEVLQAWEGLGYYSRGRNLRLAAQEVVARFDGEFPSELVSLQALPGIGRYTAGAIRSFAFDLPAPIVEANTLRLYCRLLGFDGDPQSRAGQNLLWAFAERLQPTRQAGEVNQALMELGAVVCTPEQPRCETCPVQRWCEAFAQNRQHEIPRKKARVAPTQTVEATVALRCGDRYLVRQRTPGERWAGMWDFLRFPVATVGPEQPLTKPLTKQLQQESLREMDSFLTGNLSRHPGLGKSLQVALEQRHTVTRYRIRLICLTGELETLIEPAGTQGARLRWLSLEELSDLPMPVTGRKFANHLAETSAEESRVAP